MRWCKGRIETDEGENVNGLILFPDYYEHPSTLPQIKLPENGSAEYTQNTFTETQWNEMERLGCVFLPAGGRRSGTSVGTAGTSGYYWTGTKETTTNCDCLLFTEATVSVSNMARYYGLSVRLVRNID